MSVRRSWRAAVERSNGVCKSSPTRALPGPFLNLSFRKPIRRYSSHYIRLSLLNQPPISNSIAVTMRSSLIAAIVALGATAYAQSLSGLPQCAVRLTLLR